MGAPHGESTMERRPRAGETTEEAADPCSCAGAGGTPRGYSRGRWSLKEARIETVNKPHTHSHVHEHAYTHVHSQEGMILFWVWEDYMPPGQL